ncbi:MAG: VacJ family lipoprotein [Rubrimonas sp.]
MTGRNLALAAICVGALSACAAEPAPPGQLIADPYEPFNRRVHAFNVGVDQVVLRPAAIAYDTVTPGLFQLLISNAVKHIRLPLVFGNYVLQGDVDQALATLGRFGVNTIAGAGGLLDPATEFGLPYEPTDFGLTLASWGAPEGVFVMLPFFGPSTGRDVGGRIGDVALNPLTYVTFGDSGAATASMVGQIVAPPIVARSENAAIIDEVLYETEDSYVTVRTGYVLMRRNRVSGGVVDVDALPDIFAD